MSTPLTPSAQERAVAEKLVREWYGRFVPANRIDDYCTDEIGQALINSIADAITQAVQAAYEHAAEIAQSHQCPHGWHSCGGDIAAAVRARPESQSSTPAGLSGYLVTKTRPAEPTGEKG
mgnify:FL=1